MSLSSPYNLPQNIMQLGTTFIDKCGDSFVICEASMGYKQHAFTETMAYLSLDTLSIYNLAAMKDLMPQIEFLDQELLPAFGLKNIIDYCKVVSATSVLQEARLSAINRCVINLRKRYVVKNFNLHKTDYVVKTPEQAISILKLCLTTSCIPHTVSQQNAVRLIAENTFLQTYVSRRVNRKMSDIRDYPEKEETSTIDVLSYLKKNEKNLKHVHTEVHHLVKRPECKTLQIGSDILRKDLVSVEVTVETNSYVDKALLSQALESARYRITIGGVCAAEEPIRFEKNLLPTDYIVPVSSGLLYHDFTIALNFENVPDDAWDAVKYFAVVVTWTNVPEKLLTKNKISRFPTMQRVSIPWNGQSLVINAGMGETKNRVEESHNPVLSPPEYAGQNLCGLRLATVIHENHVKGSLQEALKAFYVKDPWDLCRFRTTVTNAFIKSVRLENGVYQVFHRLERDGDTVSNFTVHSVHGVTACNAFLMIGQSERISLSSCDDEHHIGLLNQMFQDVTLVIEFPQSTFLQKLTTSFSYDVYLIDDLLRKRCASYFTEHDQIIALEDVAKLK